MPSSTVRSHRPASHQGGLRRGETASGWLFTAPPMLILLGLFLVVPVLMALWVSVSDWGGRGSPPFSGGVSFVGLKNYAASCSAAASPRPTSA